MATSVSCYLHTLGHYIGVEFSILGTDDRLCMLKYLLILCRNLIQNAPCSHPHRISSLFALYSMFDGFHRILTLGVHLTVIMCDHAITSLIVHQFRYFFY